MQVPEPRNEVAVDPAPVQEREVLPRPPEPEVPRLLVDVRLVLVQEPDDRSRHAVVDRDHEDEAPSRREPGPDQRGHRLEGRDVLDDVESGDDVERSGEGDLVDVGPREARLREGLPGPVGREPTHVHAGTLPPGVQAGQERPERAPHVQDARRPVRRRAPLHEATVEGELPRRVLPRVAGIDALVVLLLEALLARRRHPPNRRFHMRSSVSRTVRGTFILLPPSFWS